MCLCNHRPPSTPHASTDGGTVTKVSHCHACCLPTDKTLTFLAVFFLSLYLYLAISLPFTNQNSYFQVIHSFVKTIWASPIWKLKVQTCSIHQCQPEAKYLQIPTETLLPWFWMCCIMSVKRLERLFQHFLSVLFMCILNLTENKNCQQ